MKLRLTAKSYNYKGKEYHKGDVLELDSIEQIPTIFRQFFTIVEDDKVNNVADKVIDNKNTEDTTTTEIKEEAKSDTTEIKEEAKSDTTEIKEEAKSDTTEIKEEAKSDTTEIKEEAKSDTTAKKVTNKANKAKK